MKKHLFSIFFSAALLLTLAACGGQTPSQPTPSPSAPAETTPAEIAPSLAGAPTPAISPSPAPSASGDGMLIAFRAALETIYNDHLYPNGDPVDVPDFCEMENNVFAICDVDGDGTDELIYRNNDSTMAGMVCTVFGYTDTAGGVLFTEVSGFCGMTFYDNGALTIDASHNQGLAGNADFWPYSIYQYDPGQDGYLSMGYADAWDGTIFPQDFNGKAFPEDLDQDGDKVIYQITYPGDEVTETWLDGPGYFQWRDFYLSGAAELEIDWKSMTPENIGAVAP